MDATISQEEFFALILSLSVVMRRIKKRVECPIFLMLRLLRLMEDIPQGREFNGKPLNLLPCGIFVYNK